MEKIKNFGQFLNENKTEKYDSFIINIKYDVGYCDIDPKNILTSALQKTYSGWNDIIILDSYDVENGVELKLIDSKYDDETYEVIYNKNLDEDDTIDNEEDVFNCVKKSIEKITFYTYRSVHSMDDKQKTDIKILSITKI